MQGEFDATATVEKHGFVRELGLFDSSMIVIGSMIGSGIFIVPADMARNIGSPGWLLMAWLFTAVVTVAAAVSYGELAAMFPNAGGMYLYLREAFSPLLGFLYGWTLFTVIQTGTIAAVAVAFARYTGVLIPGIAEDHYLIPPIHISTGYSISLSTGQLLAIVVIVFLTWANSQGVRYGKIVQNLFTSAKVIALAALILLGLIFFKHDAVAANWGQFWTPQGVTPLTSSLSAMTAFGLFVALCVSQSGSLFSADSWHDITFAGGEVKDPARTMPKALVIGTATVTGLYLLANVAYLLVLPLNAIKAAPADRVGALMLQAIIPSSGSLLMSIAIMISTFGCINGLVLAGPRVFYSMAKDGLFPKAAGHLNKARVPGWSLIFQGVWAALLILAAHVRSGHQKLRQPVQQPPRLRHLRRPDLLHPDHRRSLAPARRAPQRRPSLQSLGLPGCAAGLHHRLFRRALLPLRLPPSHHLARPADRAHRRPRLLCHAQDDQNVNFKAACRIRAEAALTTSPNEELPMVPSTDSGPKNCV